MPIAYWFLLLFWQPKPSIVVGCFFFLLPGFEGVGSWPDRKTSQSSTPSLPFRFGSFAVKSSGRSLARFGPSLQVTELEFELRKKVLNFQKEKLAKSLAASASIVESPPSFATFFPFGRPPAPPHQSTPSGAPATTMDLTTAYRYNQNMMEYYTCKSECQSYECVFCAKTGKQKSQKLRTVSRNPGIQGERERVAIKTKTIRLH